jgi:peptide deformylase
MNALAPPTIKMITPMGEAADSRPVDSEERADETTGLTSEELEARRRALAQVRQFGDPVLRTETRPIESFDERLKAEAERMIALMRDAYGIGLAAPQVGASHRLLVYQVGDQRPRVLANPEIVWSSDNGEVLEEGCLSLTGVQVDVERPVHVLVTAQDVNGEKFKIEASGLEARVIQHELDHLDGVLIIDRTTKDQRREALRALREAEERSGYAA